MNTVKEVEEKWAEFFEGKDEASASEMAGALSEDFEVDETDVEPLVAAMLTNAATNKITQASFLRWGVAFGPWDGLYEKIQRDFMDGEGPKMSPKFHGEIPGDVAKKLVGGKVGNYLYRYSKEQQGCITVSRTTDKGGKLKKPMVVHQRLTNDFDGNWKSENGQTFNTLLEYEKDQKDKLVNAIGVTETDSDSQSLYSAHFK